jgi:16S rRNA U516 pseudouridylate synthase RsuA-like enzyme
VTDDQAEPDVVTVVNRMTAAGLSQEEIERFLTAGHVRVNGELVTDPDHPAPKPASVVLLPY